MHFSKKGEAAVAAFVPRRDPDGGFSVSALLQPILHARPFSVSTQLVLFSPGFVLFDKLLDVFRQISQLKIAATAQFGSNIG
jgi:hypothetical protein